MSKAALALICYPGNNKHKMMLQCCSLLRKVKLETYKTAIAYYGWYVGHFYKAMKEYRKIQHHTRQFQDDPIVYDFMVGYFKTLININDFKPEQTETEIKSGFGYIIKLKIQPNKSLHVTCHTHEFDVPYNSKYDIINKSEDREMYFKLLAMWIIAYNNFFIVRNHDDRHCIHTPQYIIESVTVMNMLSEIDINEKIHDGLIKTFELIKVPNNQEQQQIKQEHKLKTDKLQKHESTLQTFKNELNELVKNEQYDMIPETTKEINQIKKEIEELQQEISELQSKIDEFGPIDKPTLPVELIKQQLISYQRHPSTVKQLQALLSINVDNAEQIKQEFKSYIDSLTWHDLSSCLKIIDNYNFIPIESKNINVEFYCDGISGYKFKDFDDFYRRLEPKQFNEIVETNKLNVDDSNYEIFNPGNTIDFETFKQNIKLFQPILTQLKIRQIDENKFNEIKSKFDPKIIKSLYINKPISYEQFMKIRGEYEPLKQAAKEYFETKFKNDYSNEFKQLKQIYNEFHELYPNSSFHGTKYHTNAMINRNIFLNNHISEFKFIIDDDDFSCSLDNRNDMLRLYKGYTERIYHQLGYERLIKSLLAKLDPHHKALRTNSLEEFRRAIFTFFKTITPNKLQLFKEYMKVSVFRFRGIIKTEREIGLKKEKKEEQKSVHCSGIWSAVFPPFLINNYMNVQEMASDDVGFMDAHESLHNHLPLSLFPSYYYISTSYSGYGKLENESIEVKKRIYALGAVQTGKNRDAYKSCFLNFGKYYYKYDSVVEFDDHIAFVCCRVRNTQLNQIHDIDKYNEMLSKEELLKLH